MEATLNLLSLNPLFIQGKVHVSVEDERMYSTATGERGTAVKQVNVLSTDELIR